jgi:hypothetical protein
MSEHMNYQQTRRSHRVRGSLYFFDLCPESKSDSRYQGVDDNETNNTPNERFNMKTIKTLVAVLVLAAVSNVAFAGSETGAGVYTKACPAFGKTVIFERYVGGQTARLALVGDGDTDLDIYVYDRFGNLVASGTGLRDREVVSFFPLVTGNYRIEIVNRGGVFNRFALATN